MVNYNKIHGNKNLISEIRQGLEILSHVSSENKDFIDRIVNVSNELTLLIRDLLEENERLMLG